MGWINAEIYLDSSQKAWLSAALRSAEKTATAKCEMWCQRPFIQVTAMQDAKKCLLLQSGTNRKEKTSQDVPSSKTKPEPSPRKSIVKMAKKKHANKSCLLNQKNWNLDIRCSFVVNWLMLWTTRESQVCHIVVNNCASLMKQPMHSFVLAQCAHRTNKKGMSLCVSNQRISFWSKC